MIIRHLLLLCLAAVWLRAEVPPAQQLLPDDTIGVLTVPDWRKLATASTQSAFGRLLEDPAMKPFRQNFTSNFQADFLEPVEKQLGIKFSEYYDLLQGQVTLALMPPREGSKEFVSVLLLIDSKDKSEQLAKSLADLKKKWVSAGREVKTEKIRDVDFNTISISGADLDTLLKKAFPPDADEKSEDAKPAEKTKLRIGQQKSLLIISENEKAIEKVLARSSGGVIPPLGDSALYQKAQSTVFRDSVAQGWLNFKPIYNKILQLAAAEPRDPQDPRAAMSMNVEKLLPALGLDSIESLAAGLRQNGDGTSFDFMLGAPEAKRAGLLRIFTLEKKDAAPPAFVPADVIKFQRTRIDAQKAWAGIEKMLQQIDPSLAGIVQLMLSSAGKDKDPNFDLKKNLLGNLGDDFIQYQKAPRGTKAADLQSSPSIVLIGSPNPPQLLDAVRALTSLAPPPISSAPIKEREFLGRKIYTLSMPSPAAAAGGDADADPDDKKPAPAAPAQKLSFTTSAGYVAFSTDDAILEEFLRSGENPPKPLRSVSGLAEAAQKAGGMDNGLFTYENQNESLRATLNILKNDPEAFSRSIFVNLSHGDEEGQGVFKHLFSLKLLPSWEAISKYFGIVVLSGGTSADGYLIRAFGPTPAGLKK